jgi:uncharacterized protein (TIGR02001 family)
MVAEVPVPTVISAAPTNQTKQSIMKKTALILAALFSGAALSADEAPVVETSSYSITADIPYASKYVFRGMQYANDSLQPSLKLTAGNAYAGIWMNQPFDNDFENEVDFYGGYSFAMEDGWSFDVGGTIYHYPELDTSGGADDTTFEGYAGLNGTLDGVGVSLYAYYDFTLDVFTVQGGVSYGIPINDKVSCNISANLGHVSPDDGDSYLYYGVGAQFPITISDKATITLGANYASHDLSGADDNHFWVNAGFTYSF